MQRTQFAGGGLPRWLIVAGSAAILFHLTAIIISFLDVPNGPWTKPPLTRDDHPEPEFAHAANGLTTLHADYLRIAHNYLHFNRNRPADTPGVEFDAILRDADGKEIKRLHFPDPDSNPWVRQRQEILASGLALETAIEAPKSDVIAPVGDNRTVAIWARADEKFPPPDPAPPPPTGKELLVLREVRPYLVPRDRGPMVPAPMELSVVLARSYARYLCRAHGAATVEIIRSVRQPISYAALLPPHTVPEIEEVKRSFGRMSE